VLGVASSAPIHGRYLLEALAQMRNRGNGKGGGIASVGLDNTWFGVSENVMKQDYLLQIAYLDDVDKQVEEEHIKPLFDIDHTFLYNTKEHASQGLSIRPPHVKSYFARVKEERVKDFSKQLPGLLRTAVEDELVYQNSFQLNNAWYSSLGEKKAFVLSHGKDMMVLKLVGYAEDVITHYCLEDLAAHLWIGHHRYPTKGTVWHPGGAHPFVGMQHALVHNGDFSNYQGVKNYLAQQNMHPLFLTDTEVGALLFDLYDRVYDYSLEHVIEAMAPTTERDFEMLDKTKKKEYKALQKAHIMGSPDGPWFFITAGNNHKKNEYQLTGITDTSMLRPQVFALLDEPDQKIGLVASERQVINAFLRGLYKHKKISVKFADKYWNARGGSYTDGGAFTFAVNKDTRELECRNKFGEKVRVDE